MKSSSVTVLVLVTTLAALAACGKKEGAPSGGGGGSAAAANAPAAPANIDAAAAKAIFVERCASCHGAEGRGNGPAAAALTPKPRNYTDTTWQASVTDEQIAKAITLGGAAVGKSPMMPASPDLDEKPEVVAGLVQIVRKFGR